ncbi:MAG: ExbD/TolR family protein [Steroidobacteraceae bacterium]
MDSPPRKRRVIGEINVVPLIDVMLVLLVIFMATAPLLNQGVKVDLPKAGADPMPPSAQRAPPVVLTIDRDGNRTLNLGSTAELPLDDGQLQQGIRNALSADPERDVLIRADTSVEYGRVIGAMVLLQQSGAVKLGFLTDPPPPARRQP